MTDLVLPQLPHSFWDVHHVLRDIRSVAWSSRNPCAADALLGVCLARISAMTPIGTQVNGSTLNHFTAIVGTSGIGKSLSNRIGQELIPDIGTPLDGRPVGSGEGLIEAYLRRHKNPDTKEYEKIQHHHSAYFYVDEGEQLLRTTKRESSTTLGTLRSAWSGSVLGQLNASADTTRMLPKDFYRMSLVIGFQPEYVAGLLADDAAGTPQRFLFVSAHDRYIPDVPECSRTCIDVPIPYRGSIHVDSEILRFMDGTRRKQMRGEIAIDRHDTHRTLMHLRIAALLSILCGSTDGVSAQWWNAAAQMVDVSRNIRAALLDHYRLTDVDKATAKVQERINAQDQMDEHKAKRIATNLGRCAHRHGKAPFERLVSSLNSRDRQDASLQDAIERGYLISTGKPNEYAAGHMVDRT